MEDTRNSFQRIYDAVKKIPKGKVATYGQVARLAGNARWAHVVGFALHVNSDPEHVPCYRVVTKEGYPSKAFAFGGENMQRTLLAEEGIEFLPDGRVDMSKFLWNGERQ